MGGKKKVNHLIIIKITNMLIFTHMNIKKQINNNQIYTDEKKKTIDVYICLE